MTGLSRVQLALLLDLMEAKGHDCSHQTLVEYFGPAGKALIESSLMESAGFDSIFADPHDGPMQVEMHTNGRGLGFHSPLRGWVCVEKKWLQRYRPSLGRIFEIVLGGALRSLPDGPVEMQGSLVLDLGTMSLSAKSTRNSVWFARRLFDRISVDALARALERRPADRLRLVLTSTRHDHLVNARFPMATVVPIADVLSSQDPTLVDLGILKARFDGRTGQTIDCPVHLADDGRTLTINGTITMMFKSAIHIAIVRQFVDSYRTGHRLKAADVLERAGSSSQSFDQAFGAKWPSLKPFLTSGHGGWAIEP